MTNSNMLHIQPDRLSLKRHYWNVFKSLGGVVLGKTVLTDVSRTTYERRIAPFAPGPRGQNASQVIEEALYRTPMKPEEEIEAEDYYGLERGSLLGPGRGHWEASYDNGPAGRVIQLYGSDE